MNDETKCSLAALERKVDALQAALGRLAGQFERMSAALGSAQAIAREGSRAQTPRASSREDDQAFIDEMVGALEFISANGGVRGLSTDTIIDEIHVAWQAMGVERRFRNARHFGRQMQMRMDEIHASGTVTLIPERDRQKRRTWSVSRRSAATENGAT